MFSQDFKEFVQLLIENRAEYLIVGGYAVGIHGHPRYTGDLDIWLNPTTVNAEKIIKVIKDFGFGTIDFKINDFTTPNNIIQLGYPPLRIDLLTNIDGVSFEECYQNRKEINIEGLVINFISYHDLVKNKKASGRHKDLDDIENMKES
jgi:predicted nucleotidyltransferase